MSNTDTQYAWDRLGDSIMDSRDLIAVADEIRTALEDLAGGDESSLEALPCNENGSPDDTEQEAREILAAIDEIEGAGLTDWQYGETLIREDYFVTYAKEIADDIGAINPVVLQEIIGRSPIAEQRTTHALDPAAASFTARGRSVTLRKYTLEKEAAKCRVFSGIHRSCCLRFAIGPSLCSAFVRQ